MYIFFWDNLKTIFRVSIRSWDHFILCFDVDMVHAHWNLSDFRFRSKLLKCYFFCKSKEAYSEPCKTFETECFAKIVYDFEPLTIFTKRLIWENKKLSQNDFFQAFLKQIKKFGMSFGCGFVFIQFLRWASSTELRQRSRGVFRTLSMKVFVRTEFSGKLISQKRCSIDVW